MIPVQIKKGLDLKIEGKIQSLHIKSLSLPERVAVRPLQYEGIKPKVQVSEGDSVKTGTPLFHAALNQNIVAVSPVTGTVETIQRGHRRALEAIIIKVDKNESFIEYPKYSKKEVAELLKREQVLENLMNSGLWPAIRRFPHDVIANPEQLPKAIYVSTFNKEPFVADPHLLLNDENSQSCKDFIFGCTVLFKIIPGGLNLVHDGRSMGDLKSDNTDEQDVKPQIASIIKAFPHASHHEVEGCYPAHQPGVQSYYINPLSPGEQIWYVDPQDVIAIGELFRTGKYTHNRVLSICGSNAKKSGYVRAHNGSPVKHILDDFFDEKLAEETRFIQGGIFTGTQTGFTEFIGPQVSSLHLIPEVGNRMLFSFMRPGFNRYCQTPIYLHSFLPSLISGGNWKLSATTKGGVRACINCNICEDYCPVDLLPQQLFKSALAEDFEDMEKFFLLDCSECGICSYVCPSKINLSQVIKDGKNLILKEEEVAE